MRARPYRLLLLALFSMTVGSRLAAQAPLEAPAPPACTGVNHVTWPSVNPVWDFCWTRPASSSGGNGSGVELTNVKYNGVLVLSRAHIPILNVKYVQDPNFPNGCGGPNLCYRDWLFSERAFQCSPCQDASGAAVSCSSASAVQCTGTTTSMTVNPPCPGGQSCTVCQHPGTDAGVFAGVAVEDLGTSLRLTSQSQAGWYRYIPVWQFFPDGTIQAGFDATSVNHTCVAYTHHHHVYWRFDVDVNGAAGNYVDEVLTGGATQRVATERNFIDTSPARSRWRIGSAGSPYVVEISRNAGDEAAGDASVVPNDFPIADGWVLAYNANEISDAAPVQGCGAGLNAFVNNQNVNGADVVLWVRASALHQGEPGGLSQDCSVFGPTLRVLPAGPPVGTQLSTLTPCRIVDTRDPAGPYGGPALQAGGSRSFVLAGRCAVPMTAKSVAANVTVIQPGSAGHVTAYPAGSGVPLASTINFSAGQTRANNAILQLGTGGAISVNSVLPTGTVQFVLDVTGYFE